jgi:GNAT superfamily N-acetyltransferase
MPIVEESNTRQAGLVRLREWDPATLRQRRLMRGYGDKRFSPPTSPRSALGTDGLRNTSVTMSERRLTWLAGDDDGTVIRYGRLLVLGDLGVLELFVVPRMRGKGVGPALLKAVADRALTEQFNSLGVEVVGGTPSALFYQSQGFNHVYTEMRSVLSLSDVDLGHIQEMAAGLVQGYRIEVYAGDLPDELLPTYAEAKQVRRLDPTGEMDLRPSSYDTERLRASLHCLNARGLRPYIVVAIHERSEKVAALTELVVPAQHPTRADQYDTVIVPAHNGYGLARAIKARMLLELRVAEPRLSEVQTWHATDREPLQQVNKELGFQPDREWREYEVDTAALVARLGV